MFGIYASPTATFARLKEKPAWLLTLALVLVAQMVSAVVTAQFVDWQAQREVAVEQMEKRGMTEEQIEQSLQAMERFTGNRLMRVGLPLVSSLINGLAAFFLLALVYNLFMPMLGGTGNYRRMLAVCAHAGLVWLPGSALRIVLVLLRRSADVSTSLLAAFPGMKPGFLTVVMGRADLFVFWQLILTGLGIKVVFDIKGGRSYWLVFSAWLVLTLLFGALSLLGGGKRA